MELAKQLSAQAQRAPERFAELAQRYSDDEVTRSGGGSLGGMAASQFLPWPEVFKSLTALDPGRVSDVVETTFGFHVFLRRHAPREETVSGARIVIGYDDASWLAKFLQRPDRPTVKRTREVALRMADEVYEEALKSPDAFEQLVREYSEHRDVARGGDFGQWSTHEVTPFPREVEILRHLPIGGIRPPIDGLSGIQIIKRTDNRPRPQYRMSAIQLRFDPDRAPNAPNSRESVAKKAAFLIQQVADKPEMFSKLQREFCCTGAVSWSAGRRDPALEKAIERLRTGEVSTHPVEADRSYFIVKRLTPLYQEG